MATIFYCNNVRCSAYRREVNIPSITYVMRDGHLVPKEKLKCKECGEELISESKFEGVPSFNTFDSLSKEDKKKMILKRNEKVKKQDAEMHRYYEKKALGVNLN